MGRFLVTGLALDDDIARFSKDTRTNTNFRSLSLVAGGEVNFPGIALLPLERGAVFFAEQGGEAAVGSLGTSAAFAESSFVNGETVFTGRVAAYLAVTTVDESHFAAAFPGDFVGELDGGTEIPLDALGVIWTSILSADGELALAPGKSVLYRLGIDTSSGTPPPAATVWSLNLESGRWEEVGESTLVDNIYELEAASLAPICWAVEATDQCQVTGMVHDAAGRPLSNTRVEGRDLQGRFRQATMTQEDGSFSLELSRSEGIQVTPLFGSIRGESVVINTVTDCPAVIDQPLTVTLPDYSIDVAWTDGYGDLDGHWIIADEWLIDYVRPGGLNAVPYAHYENDERAGRAPEVTVGRRWYDGVSQYWVHDYQNRNTEALRESGARVDLVINEETWTFDVTDAAFDPAGSDSSGWWHVFDVIVDGVTVEVDTVQTFVEPPDIIP
jgi:hypothetical protein